MHKNKNTIKILQKQNKNTILHKNIERKEKQ
jgi:hypothetical protein